MSIHGSLEGDGISFPIFNLLWMKSPQKNQESKLVHQQKENDERQKKTYQAKNDRSHARLHHSSIIKTNSSFPEKVNYATQIRIPDTVLFQFGQALHWYFTSEKRKKATILRKRKSNVTVKKIEERFLSVFQAENEIVAYFISKGEEKEENGARDSEIDKRGVASIEYFDKRGLSEFIVCVRSVIYSFNEEKNLQ